MSQVSWGQEVAAHFQPMSAQNFHFAPKFLPNWTFRASNFVFLEENFLTRKKFPNRLKFELPSPAPCHDATSLTDVTELDTNESNIDI